ncbi:protein of unknown function DUF152 [Denitrovibrio acetiphilus DSM 12809]|uniref:Purine nucleoside phosphorylase n=1 Tax=Denitrovibrio acetiphilus (strain DSM 12809 / NBRC 114555 / N2460) TaxID=522772 RepID=D4H7X9_DENA2|nr:polyphenol oxidase family protein [Denitrovibrio acetiphilus]ADD68128.1 protein of unknown function DUF152 [Denitrovibrio acetiphilus DSM 12809]
MDFEKSGILVKSYEHTPDGVDCFVTTRKGGYSKGVFDSMNTAVYNGDEPRDVIKNIELLQSVFCLKSLNTLFQVHGKDVIEITSENRVDVLFSEGDGLFTLENDMALGVLTADCYNLFFAGEKGIAALHCGHKSVSADIMTAGIQMFEKYNDFPVFAGIGPGISAEKYEVGVELAEKFDKICPKAVKQDGNSFRLCLRTVIEENLISKGITNIEHLRNCTFTDENLYSYRRDNGNTGRMTGVIVRRSIV